MEGWPENVVHVTGFGVFRGFTESNPSWDAVSQLPDYIIHNDQPIQIVKHNIPVTYAAVDAKIKEIWSSKPKVSKKNNIYDRNNWNVTENLDASRVWNDFLQTLLCWIWLEIHSDLIFSWSFIAVFMQKPIKSISRRMRLMGISVKPITQIKCQIAAVLRCRTVDPNAKSCARHWIWTISSMKQIQWHQWNAQIIRASESLPMQCVENFNHLFFFSAFQLSMWIHLPKISRCRSKTKSVHSCADTARTT